ncbi:type I glyceraldehyde-3-phosphate dehydrogenase [Pseudothauera rhizosphaerae]|uniref:Glyceraldehyde-3-phosphate dehydrogenase n=1 Tax=Pseudothauera rhizosphaerae TaxID=2565932 RepID=A0A4S4AN87_9RHOO|nr:type I glyceraldehyde-3-phosphate dehydrogenase [Pseudothauera rhizosphaerae]THF60672.1 type I glyceraldehyde-3-phosphate dehydrogenase [Pseudothauera rhizosphaerae]
MTIKVAINGYGRIGRCTLRALYELGLRDRFEIVAVNASGDLATNAHLTKYDTTHGRFRTEVATEGDNTLIVGGDRIPFYSTKNPLETDWGRHGVDVLLECTGAYTTKAKAEVHLKQGAKKVLISAPGGDDVDATIVYGVNHDIVTPAMTVVSNASCTTNCLAPVAKVLQDAIGIEKGLMTTIHAYTNDQVLVDVRHKDLRRARAGAQNIIPTKTGAAKAVGLVLPALKGKFDGFALRVPTMNVSLVDLTFTASRATSRDEINALMHEAARGALKGVLAVNEDPLVSSDFNHDSHSSVFDATQTRVMDGNLVKVLAWYDNEWGYSCRMLDAARVLAGAR